MTAETPRVGDTVRLTRVDGEVTTTITGPVKPCDPFDDPASALCVGSLRCHPAPAGWTVEVIERALPPEPPTGSIVAEVALAQVAIVTNHARHVANDPTACDGARTLAEAMVLAMDVVAGVLADRPVPLAPVMPLPTRIVPGRRLTVGEVWAANNGGGRDE